MYTMKNTTNGQQITCKDAKHVRRIIKNLVKQNGTKILQEVEVSNGKNVWLAYEF